MSPRDGTAHQMALRDFAMRYPGAHEDFPWGERVIKVKGKVFLFLGKDKDLRLSVKLPSSGLIALDLPFTRPPRTGWASAAGSRRDSGRRKSHPSRSSGLDRRELPRGGAEEARGRAVADGPVATPTSRAKAARSPRAARTKAPARPTKRR